MRDNSALPISKIIKRVMAKISKSRPGLLIKKNSSRYNWKGKDIIMPNNNKSYI